MSRATSPRWSDISRRRSARGINPFDRVDMMSQSERRLLLVLARGAIAAHVNGASRPAKYELSDGELNARSAGVFVTLHKGRELRGCIGHIEGGEPLPQA